MGTCKTEGQIWFRYWFRLHLLFRFLPSRTRYSKKVHSLRTSLVQSNHFFLLSLCYFTIYCVVLSCCKNMEGVKKGTFLAGNFSSTYCFSMRECVLREFLLDE